MCYRSRYATYHVSIDRLGLVLSICIKVSSRQHKLFEHRGSYTAVDDVIPDRCGDCPGARRQEAAPTHTYTDKHGREETQRKGKTRKEGGKN